MARTEVAKLKVAKLKVAKLKSCNFTAAKLFAFHSLSRFLPRRYHDIYASRVVSSTGPSATDRKQQR
jgi:hypothetical protein